MDLLTYRAELVAVAEDLKTLEVQIFDDTLEIEKLDGAYVDLELAVDAYSTNFSNYLSSEVVSIPVYKEAYEKMQAYYDQLSQSNNDLGRRRAVLLGKQKYKARLQNRYEELVDLIENVGAKIIQFPLKDK